MAKWESAPVYKPKWAAAPAYETPRSQPVADEEDARTLGDSVNDFVANFGVGSGQIVGLIGSAYGLATGDMENRLTETGARTSEFWEKRRTPAYLEAEKARQAKIDATEGEFNKAGVALWETVTNPMLLVGELAKQAPNLAVGGIGGSAGKIATTASAKALGLEVTEQAVKRASTAAATGTGVGMSSADFGQSAYEQLMSLSDEVWLANPQVQERIGGNLDLLPQVKREIATGLAQNSAIAGGLVTYGLNKLPGAKTIEKALGGEALTGTRLRRAAAGLAGETLSEGLEEGTTQLTANVAQSQIDPNTGLSTGVGQAAGLGAAAGGGLGLITGALTPGLRTVQPGESIPVEPGSGLRTVQPGEFIPVEPGPVPAEVSPEQATTFARTRLRELITKGKGTPDISFVDPTTGQTRTTPGRPAEILSDDERTELEFLANNAENPSALGKAYNLKIKGAAEQRLNEAATAADAVQAAADMVDMDIEALEREAGLAPTPAVADVPQNMPAADFTQNLAAGRGLLQQVMPTSVTFGEPPVAGPPEPTLTAERLMQADISTMPAPERQEFLSELTAARTANSPEQRQTALTRAAEVYGRTVGPIQTRAPAAAPAATAVAPAPERVRTEEPDMQALLQADTRSMATEDRTEFVTQLNMAQNAAPGPVQQAALTRAAKVYGRTVGPIQGLAPAATGAATAVAPAPTRRSAVPRPTNILGRPTSEYTESQLEAIITNDKTAAVTRRGAEVELRARAEVASTQATGAFAPTMAPTGAFPQEGTVNVERFITVPETVPFVATQPVAGQSAGQRARAAAQRSMDKWASSRGVPSPVTFNPAPADLEAGVAEIADLIGSQLGGQVVAFSDTRPGAINGVAIGKVAFVNVSDNQAGVPRTALHEFKHTVEQIAKAETSAGMVDTPAQEFVEQIDSVFGDITEEGKRAYLENFLAAEELSQLQGDAREARVQELLQDPELRSEMTADFLGNRATDKKFWQDLAKADPTGFEAFVNRWLAAVNNLLATLRGAKNSNKTESAKVDSYIRDLNKAKLTAQSALINYRKATQGQTVQAPQETVTPDALAATSEDVTKAEAFEDSYGILPYTSAGQLTVDAKFSIKQSGDFGTHPILGIPINKNGSVSLYFPTDNATAQLVRREKLLRASDPSAIRVFLTNESSAPKVAANPGDIQQPMAGANVLVQVNPDLVQLLKEHPDGRKDFFIPIAEGATFKAKMTKLFTLNAPRDQGLHPDRTLAEINDGIRAAVNRLQAASTQARKVIVSAARKVLRADHNVGTLLGENDKLAKTRTGDYGIEYNGKRVYSLGLGLASAQKINNKQKLTSCPQSAICESLCLGETSGQNLLYGGVGQFRSGPRLAQYLKTEAMVVHPEEFTSVLYAEIESFRLAMMKEGKQPTVRLNVTSDFAPKVWEPLIKAFPDVMFYDYTKLATDPIAENHHLTYSSTGASQIVDGKLVENKLSNWPKMVPRLREGKNVAMAFTSKTDMPDFIVDEATGERFQVWNGDNYDARFLDPKPGDPANKLNKGMIVGLTNKDRTGDAQTAAARTDGFFMDYDRKRDGDTLTIRDPRTLGSAASRPVKMQFSRSQKETSGVIKATPGVDMVRMARLLGPQLYGNMSDIGLVTIKEVFQNSFDALKGAIQKGDKTRGLIDVEVDSYARTITITDDGTGMTPEIINKAFLTLAGTSKETDRASGGLGIAKMLFLFGNESLSLRTVRNGVESTLSTSGAELMASFSDPAVAPDIQTRSTSDPSGTAVTIKIPETYTDENGEVQSIDFPYRWSAGPLLESSPLLENIEVRLNGETLPIGANFPVDDYTVLANAKFAWGNMRVLVRPRKASEYGENMTVLSNGLYQFGDTLKKNPLDFWGPAAPFQFYLNIEPTVPADSPLYPIALNRKGFSMSAKSDFEALKKYLSVLYANKNDAESAQSFGDLEQVSADSKTSTRISLVVPEAEQGSTLSINPGDKVEVRDGRMYVNNREMPEITKESMAALVRDPGKFKIDPALIDPSLVLIHDNLMLNELPFSSYMRDTVGSKFDDFTFEVADVFKTLRDATAKVGGAKYSDVSDVAVGVSFDLGYYGVNIMVPFRGMMINPAFIRGEDPAKAAQTVVGTMIHELVHHAERNHSETGFIPELQRVFMALSLSRDSEASTRQLQNVFNKYPDIMRELRRIQDNEKQNLKPKGVRLKGDADTTGVGGMEVGSKAGNGASASARLSAPGGARRDDSDLPGIRRAVEGSGRNRPTGEERRRPSSADGGYDPGLAFRDLIPQFSRGQQPPTDIEQARLKRFSRAFGDAVRERAGQLADLTNRLAAEDKYLGLEVGDTFLTQNQDGGRFRHRVLAKSVLQRRSGEYELNGKNYTPSLRVETIGPDGEASTGDLIVEKLRGRVTKMGGPRFSRSQTDTPAFKRWFGDSKIVDENGDPVIMVHASPRSDISSFKLGADNGVWFSPSFDTSEADIVASEGRKLIYNPDPNNFPDVAEGMTFYPVYLSIKNPVLDDDMLTDFYNGDITARELLAQGFDGLLWPDGVAVVLSRTQIKSAIGNTGNFDPADSRINFSRAQASPMKLYSALAKAVEAGPARAPKDQWANILRKQKFVTEEEITWTGLEDWLEMQSGQVPREAVSEFLAQNGVQVGEVVLGGSTRYPPNTLMDPQSGEVASVEQWRADFESMSREAWFGLPEEETEDLDWQINLEDVSGDEMFGSETRFAQYVLPGGTNYREVLLTLPVTKTFKVTPVETARFKELEAKSFDDMSEAERVEYDKLLIKHEGLEPSNFRSSHWPGVPNVLAHVRMNDRIDADGARVLFVEELQSDWAQEGRKKGFTGTNKQRVESGLASKYPSLPADKDDWSLAILKQVGATEQEQQQWWSLSIKTDSVPAAPFVQSTDSWLRLALKRVIAMAVEGGYDKIAFTNGQQNAERYDLSNTLETVVWSKIGWQKNVDLVMAKDVGNIVLSVDAKSGVIQDGVNAENFKGKELDDVIGKDLAEKILSETSGYLSGLDLKVGGEGMRAFYDNIVPKTLNKLLPKIGGGKVERVNLESDEGSSKYIIDAEDIGADEDFEQEVVIRDEMSLEGVASFNSIAEADAWLADNDVDVSAKMQTGFAVTREMTDQVMDAGLPLFSRRQNIFGQPMPAGTWQVGDSRMDEAIYFLQDKLVDTKRVVEGIGNVADKFDAYLQETLYHGKVSTRTTDFADGELKPLIEAMGRNKVKIEDLDEYLHNRHAEERNIAMAKRDPNQRDGLSGITTADARAYLAAIPPARRALLEGLARRVDAITAGTRNALLNAGLESQGMLDAWENTYSAYVPLMREELDYDPAGGPGTGAGFNVRGGSSRRAVGSTDRRVVDILANVVLQRERAIVRAEKNRVSKALYGLAIQNPLPEFWLPINLDAMKDPAALQAELIGLGLSIADAQNIAQQPKERVVDPRTGLTTERPNHRLLTSANVITARVNGKDRFLVLNPQNPRAERMALALKNLDVDHLGRALGLIAQGTRWFASVNTQYNPIFGVINFLRDVQGGMLNLSSTELKGKQGAVLAGTVPALLGISAGLRTRGATGQWAQLWREFQEVGGQTGYRDQFSQSEERAKALESELKALSNGTAKKAGKAVGKLLSDYNTAMENAVRLSAYKAGLDKGMSKERAAALAKNLTVNFNKKGQVATQMGALYAFFNASVQGTARLLQTLSGPAGKKIIYGGLLLGSAQAMLMAMAGFDEEEPPEFVRERNLIIPTGDGKYLTLPMPLGFNVIPNFSRIVTEWALSGFERTPQRVAQIATSFFEMFNPIGSAGLSVQTLAPTVVDPLVAISENRDWTGTPIAREDFNSLDPTPGYTRAKDTASEFSKALAEFLNLASGGTEFAPGVISPTPDQLDYLIGQVTGGIGREYLKAEQTVTAYLTGEELPTYKIPLVGRFVGNTSGSSAVSSRFYESIRRMNVHNNELGGRREAGRPVGEYLRENPEARLAPQALRTYRQVQDLRRRKREMLDRDASKESIRRIEAQITQRMQQFNDRLDRM